MITVTRAFEFDYGHRLQKHESLCRHVHGHRGKIEATMQAPELDEVGRVIDFGVLKVILGSWLNSNWDHCFIAEKGDPIISWLEANRMRVFILPKPPTAENLAAYFAWVAEKLLPNPVQLTRVRVWETPSCCATWEIDGTGSPGQAQEAAGVQGSTREV